MERRESEREITYRNRRGLVNDDDLICFIYDVDVLRSDRRFVAVHLMLHVVVQL